MPAPCWEDVLIVRVDRSERLRTQLDGFFSNLSWLIPILRA
jgi:hypothetical protein